MKSFPSLALAGLASAFAGTAASAQTSVVYSDTFARTTGVGVANTDPVPDGAGVSDWGTADNALGGTATVDWLVGRANQNPPTGGAQFTTNANVGNEVGTTFNGLAHTTVSAITPDSVGFGISYTFSRDGSDAIDNPQVPRPTGGYFAVSTGYDESVNEFRNFSAVDNAQFALFVQQANNGNTGNAEIFIGGASTGNFDYGDPRGVYSVDLDFVPVLAGAYGEADTINYTVTITGDTGPAVVQTGTLTGSDQFGDFALGTNLGSGAYIDNLVVTNTVVPEPAGLALLGLGSAALLGRRRRA